jgi:hypothetical protein
MKKIPDSLSALLWIVVLVIIGVASMSSIRWTSPSLHMNSNFGPSSDLTHATVLGLGVLVVAFFSLSYNFPKVARSWNLLLKSSIIALLAGIVISSLFASDKTLAFYTGGGLVIGLILMAVTRRLADSAWKVQLALVVIVSLGVTFAARTWMRELWEFDEGWQQYLETREEFWGKQGKDLDDPTVKMFEARMLSRDNGGFFFHGNLGGMYLATVWLTSLTLVGRRWRERKQQYGWAWFVTAGLMSGFIFSALILTQSKGAILSAGVGLMVIGVVWRFRGGLRRHFKAAVLGAALLMVLAGGAVIGYGVAKGTLPTLSMAYRWQYWVASYEMFRDHPLTGVGAGNYGHYYQLYKLPEAEEEINSPHNFIVQGFTQFGLIGGLGFLLLPAGIFYGIAKRSKEKDWPELTTGGTGPSGPMILLAMWVGIFGVLFAFNPSGQLSLIGQVAMNLPYMLIFPAAFVLGSIRGDRFEGLDDSPVGGWETACLAGAGVAFILGDLVNFSLEEPSTQFLFFFLMGLALAGKESAECSVLSAQCEEKKENEHRTLNIERSTSKGNGVQCTPYGILVLIFLYGYFLMLPAVRGERAAAMAERVAPSGDAEFDRVYRTYAELAKRYSYDGHLAAKAGERLLQISQVSRSPAGTIEDAIGWFEAAASRAEANGGFYSKIGQGEMLLTKLEPVKMEEHFERAEKAFEEAWARSPGSRSLTLSLGLVYVDHLRHAAEMSEEKRAELAEKAIEKLKLAEELDKALPAESLRHFSKQQRERLTAGIRTAEEIRERTLNSQH